MLHESVKENIIIIGNVMHPASTPHIQHYHRETSISGFYMGNVKPYSSISHYYIVLFRFYFHSFLGSCTLPVKMNLYIMLEYFQVEA